MNLVGRPDFVKQASEFREESYDSIPASSFLDPETRLYPCHTKEATYAAACYIADTEGTDSRLLERLEKFANSWGIIDPIRQVFVRCELNKAMRKKAAEELTFALDETYQGQPVQRFPINTPEMTKASAARFYADRTKYPFSWRHKTAVALHNALRQHGVTDLHDHTIDYIEKAAGYGVLSKSAVMSQLAERQIRRKGHAALDNLSKVATAVVESEPNAKLTKICCQAFAKFDEGVALRDELRLPEETLVDGTLTKLAREREYYIKLANGTTVDSRTLNRDDVAEALGKPGDAVESFTDQLRKLSASDAEIVTNL